MQSSDDAVYGLFTLSGDVLWSLALGLDGPAAEDVATRFAGFPITLDHPELGDAIGEITNITAGLLRRLLVARGLTTTVSLSSVLSAKGLRFLIQRGQKVTGDQMHFRSPAGRIWISVYVGMNPGLVL